MRKRGDRKELVKHASDNGTLEYRGYGGGRGGGVVYTYSVVPISRAPEQRFLVEVNDYTGLESHRKRRLSGETPEMSFGEGFRAEVEEVHKFAERVGRFAIVKIFEFDEGPKTALPPIRSKMTPYWESLTDQQASMLINTFVDLYFEVTGSYRLNSTAYSEETDVGKMYTDNLIFDPYNMPKKYYLHRFAADMKAGR